jgi:hypothetical protein
VFASSSKIQSSIKETGEIGKGKTQDRSQHSTGIVSSPKDFKKRNRKKEHEKKKKKKRPKKRRMGWATRNMQPGSGDGEKCLKLEATSAAFYFSRFRAVERCQAALGDD